MKWGGSRAQSVRRVAAFLAVALVCPAIARAQSLDGAGLADACTSCHGIGGHSQGSIPSIGGVDKETLLAQLRAFKAEQGDASIMNRIARGYTDEETLGARGLFQRGCWKAMSVLTRRSFVGGAAAAIGTPSIVRAAGASARVVIIGGGFGGASLARYIRRNAPDVAVTLIEKDTTFVTCPFSNFVLGGMTPIDKLTFGYDKVKAAGVNVIHDLASKIDPVKKTVATAGGQALPYDFLVASPGIQFDWTAIQHYDQAASGDYAARTGRPGRRPTLLRKQLEAMNDGGLVVIGVPAMPYRCPPGPYERASLVAHYLKANKPKSKITILDASDSFIKQDLFMESWSRLYPGMITWVPASKSGKVTAVDTKNMTVSTDFDDYKAAVANIIPPQKAAQIVIDAGLDQGTGFCAIDPITFESKAQKGVYVLGDATIAGEMPKSGFAANNQAKACGRAILASIAGKAPTASKLINVCYSTVAPDYAFEIVDDFTVTADNIALSYQNDRTTPLKASDARRAQEAANAKSWYANITAEMFG